MKKYFNIPWKFAMYILTFYLIYRPNISPWIGNLNILHLVTGLVYVLLIFRHLTPLKRTLKKRSIGIFIVLLIIALIYISFISLINVKTLNVYGVQIMVNFVFIMLPNILFICLEFLSKKYRTNEFITFILNIGLIQSIIAIIMVFVPTLRIIAMDSFMASAMDKTSEIFRYRIYGFSSDFTFSMQIFQGFLMGLAMLFSVYISKKYYIYIPFFMISAILNGRTGIIISICSTIIVFLIISIKNRSFKNILNILFISCVTFIILRLGLTIVKDISEYTYEWVMRFFYETNDLLNGNVNGTYNLLFNNMLFFPKGVNFIAGIGHRVFGGREISYLNSDIGYVNDIFIGGILFLIFFYTPVIKLLMYNIMKDDINICIGILSILFILIANYKGEIFRPNVLMYGILLIKIYSIVSNSNEKT